MELFRIVLVFCLWSCISPSLQDSTNIWKDNLINPWATFEVNPWSRFWCKQRTILDFGGCLKMVIMNNKKLPRYIEERKKVPQKIEKERNKWMKGRRGKSFRKPALSKLRIY